VSPETGGGHIPLSGALLVMPPDTVVVDAAGLPSAVRQRIRLQTGDRVVSRPAAAVPSVVVDDESARLLAEFREPRTVVDAVISYSRRSRRDPEEVLEEAFGLIRHLVRSRFLALASSPAAAPIAPLLSPGDEAAGFTVLRCVKMSDATEVYQAAASSGLTGALKITRPGATPMAAEMLATEIRALERLDGTATPRLLTQGEFAGRPYLITEWFPGVQVSLVAGELRQRATAETRSKLADLCHGCAEAYAALHRQGVVHGDVHLGNLLVDEHSHLRVVDFGLARWTTEQQVPGSRGGVAAFFEPEYARAALAGVALPPATMLGEQYAVAAVVYSLLTGEHYLDFSLEQDEMFRQICTDPPVSLARRNARWWPEAEPALHRALAKEPASRHPSVAAFAAALRAAADAREASRRPYSPAKPAVFPKETRIAGDGLTGAEPVVRSLVQAMGLGSDLLRNGITQAPTCSLSHGAAGVAYGLYQLACRWQDSAVLALADVWASHAVAACDRPDAFYSTEDGLTPQTVGTTSPFHLISGVHCVRALVSQAMGDADSQRASVRAFLAASGGPCSRLDITLGWSGTLLACGILTEATGAGPAADEPLRSCGDAVMSRIWDELDCHPPLADGPPIRHLGVAHGWSGLAYAAMRWCQATGQPLPGRAEERLQQVAEFAQPGQRDCRWPWLIPAGNGQDDKAYMPGWCNGTAGYVHVWVLAHQMFGDERYLELAQRAAWNAFDEPGSMANLCCGLAGRAYGLLCLYKYTQEREWLVRAANLAQRALASRRDPCPPLPSHGPAVLEQRRHSLYKGELGLVLLLADLSAPDEAWMPFFESQGWA
jgi:eukaryotic-like serine/threonine-protein kinase